MNLLYRTYYDYNTILLQRTTSGVGVYVTAGARWTGGAVRALGREGRAWESERDGPTPRGPHVLRSIRPSRTPLSPLCVAAVAVPINCETTAPRAPPRTRPRDHRDTRARAHTRLRTHKRARRKRPGPRPGPVSDTSVPLP